MFSTCPHRDVWLVFEHRVGRNQNLVDLMKDPVDADAVAVRHVRLVHKDAALKIQQTPGFN